MAYSLFFPDAFAFFHLALAAAAILFRAAALNLRLAFQTGFAADFRPLAFAQRARWAAAIAALPAALMPRRFRGAVLALAVPPKMRVSLVSSDSSLLLMLAARRSCLTDRSIIMG